MLHVDLTFTMKTVSALSVVALAGLYVVALGARVPAPLTLSRVESKRDVADKLLLLAEEHKEQSLHDVLRDRDHPSRREGATNGSTARGVKEKSESAGRKKAASVVQKMQFRQPQNGKNGEGSVMSVEGSSAQNSQSQPGDVSRDAIRPVVTKRSSRPSRRLSGERPKIHGATPGTATKESEHVVVNTWSEQFARGTNGTIRHSELAAYFNISALVVSAAELRPATARDSNLPELRRPTEYATVLFRRAGSNILSPAKSLPSAAQLPVTLPVLVALDELELDDVEADVMLRALRVLKASPVDEIEARVKALLILEEVCSGVGAYQPLATFSRPAQFD